MRPLAAAILLIAIAPVTASSHQLAYTPTTTRSANAVVHLELAARDVPGGARTVGMVPTQSPWAGGRVRLLVLGRVESDGREWLRVRLLQRPNRSAGWISGEHVRVVENRWRVEVSRARRILTVRRDGRIVRRFDRIDVGRPATPTPAGLFAVAESFASEQPGVGRWVIALTAFSEVLHSFAGGPGLIAIHGQADGDGTNGCIALPTAAARWLFLTVPAGTPVVVG